MAESNAIDAPDYAMFMVGERPFVVWDPDIRGQNVRFLKGLDPAYFEHVGKINAPALDTAEKNYAALEIRSAYSHGLETFLALAMAAVQANSCVFAWLLRYQLGELRLLANELERGKAIHSCFLPRPRSWSDLAALIFDGCNFPNPEYARRAKANFARLWRRFALDFCDEEIRSEYHGIKHGLRIKSGGFILSVGTESKFGEVPPAPDMHSLGGSDHGSSYLVLEEFEGAPANLRVRADSRNWDPRNLLAGLHLLSVSIHNIVNFALVRNKVTPAGVWRCPDDDDVFDAPWLVRPGVVSFRYRHGMTRESIKPFSREEIIGSFQRNYDAYEELNSRGALRAQEQPDHEDSK